MTSAVFRPMQDYARAMDSYCLLESFSVIHTSHSCQFIAEGRDKLILTDNPLSFKALGMMRALKKEVRSRLPKLVLDFDTTHYYGFRNIAGSGDCNEYDLEHAYLSALYELGAITDTLYNKLETEVKKKERLAVVGSLATNKLIIDYRYGEEINKRRERDMELLKVWKTISFKVDQKIRAWFLGDQASLFYWVDGLFTKSETQLPGMGKVRRCKYETSHSSSTIRIETPGTRARKFPFVRYQRQTAQTPAIQAAIADERQAIG
jgi:hypothetical protein